MTRLIFLIIFFLISLLAVLKAPAYYLWLLAIVVTEYPLIFVAITALLTAWGIWVTKYQFAGTFIGVVAILLYLSPILGAFIVSNSLQSDMATAFTGKGAPPVFPARAPFSFAGLFHSTSPAPFKSVSYVKYQDTSLTLDFYAASTGSDTSKSKNRPCVVVVHGGSWSSGDSQQLPDLNGYLAAKGYQVAAINYRLAPRYQTPAPVEDIKNALDYLCKHADELHIDTTRFVLLGRSAGAQIALLAAYTLHDPRLKGVIDFYGPADMVWGYSIPSNPWIMDSRKVMGQYIGGTYKQVPEKFAACSPLEFVDRTSMPTLLIHGGNDVLVSPEHSRRLDEKLDKNNIRHFWLKLPWSTHGFDFNLNGPGGQLSTYAVETFLDTVTQ